VVGIGLVEDLFERVKLAGRDIKDFYDEAWEKHPGKTWLAHTIGLGALGGYLGEMIMPSYTEVVTRPGYWENIYEKIKVGEKTVRLHYWIPIKIGDNWVTIPITRRPTVRAIYETVKIGERYVEERISEYVNRMGQGLGALVGSLTGLSTPVVREAGLGIPTLTDKDDYMEDKMRKKVREKEEVVHSREDLEVWQKQKILDRHGEDLHQLYREDLDLQQKEDIAQRWTNKLDETIEDILADEYEVEQDSDEKESED
jgi:hypothetical protein